MSVTTHATPSGSQIARETTLSVKSVATIKTIRKNRSTNKQKILKAQSHQFSAEFEALSTVVQ